MLTHTNPPLPPLPWLLPSEPGLSMSTLPTERPGMMENYSGFARGLRQSLR